jgi:hypothetical protein
VKVIKVAVLEVDGEEYSYPTEYDLLTAIQDVGFTGGNSATLPYHKINSGVSAIIAEGQNMLTTHLELKGCLVINGCLRLV